MPSDRYGKLRTLAYNIRIITHHYVSLRKERINTFGSSVESACVCVTAPFWSEAVICTVLPALDGNLNVSIRKYPYPNVI